MQGRDLGGAVGNKSPSALLSVVTLRRLCCWFKDEREREKREANLFPCLVMGMSSHRGPLLQEGESKAVWTCEGHGRNWGRALSNPMDHPMARAAPAAGLQEAVWFRHGDKLPTHLGIYISLDTFTLLHGCNLLWWRLRRLIVYII